MAAKRPKVNVSVALPSAAPSPVAVTSTRDDAASKAASRPAAAEPARAIVRPGLPPTLCAGRASSSKVTTTSRASWVGRRPSAAAGSDGPAASTGATASSKTADRPAGSARSTATGARAWPTGPTRPQRSPSTADTRPVYMPPPERAASGGTTTCRASVSLTVRMAGSSVASCRPSSWRMICWVPSEKAASVRTVAVAPGVTRLALLGTS